MVRKMSAGEMVNILLVEDNDAHAELVMRGLKEHRIINRIIHVSDGEQALDYLLHRDQFADKQAHPLPNLILLDLRLPKVDGLEVLQTIKKTDELSSIPVVILTTSEAEPDVAKAYELHANSYLVKPVDFTNFTKLMDDLGYYWLGWNHTTR